MQLPKEGLISILPSWNDAWSLSILHIRNLIALSSSADIAYLWHNLYLSCHLNVYIPIFSSISSFCQPRNMWPHFKAILNGCCRAKPLIWTSMVLPWFARLKSQSSTAMKHFFTCLWDPLLGPYHVKDSNKSPVQPHLILLFKGP